MSAARAGLLATSAPLAEIHDVLLLDLDGTVYVGPDVLPGVPDVVSAAVRSGSRPLYLTNNASRPTEATAEHLRQLGLPATADDVVSSAQAAARMLADELPDGAAVLVVGGAGLEVALREVGLAPVASMDDNPVAVVQGFSPDVGWRMLTEGTFGVRRGLPWVASNTDLTIPTPRGVAPGNGALVAVITTATGATPRVAGKPERPILDLALERCGARRPLVVGDRLDTDIAFAESAGLPSLLVLTGVTDLGQLLRARPGERPTYVSVTLDGLLCLHPEVRPTGRPGDAPTGTAGPVEWRCGDWTAQVRAGALVVRRATTPVRASSGSDDAPTGTDDDRSDGIRAACAAAWTATDAAQAAEGGARVDLDDACRLLLGG